jgi:hypothetical protein
MKKIILLFVFTFVSLFSNAQNVVMFIVYGGVDIPVSNGQTFTYPSSVDPSTLPVSLTVKISNNGISDLVLTKTNNKFINLTGTGASDFIIDESGLTGSIPKFTSQTFTMTFSSSAPNGTRTADINISSNAPAYVGSLTYTILKTTTSTIPASAIGLSVFPNPSSTGTLNIQSSAQLNKVEVIGVNGVVETYTTSVFTTSQKGLLVVRMYTDKGIVTEKVLVQ